LRAPSAGFWDEWPAGLSLYAGAALAVVLLVVVRPARWEFTRRVGLVAGVFGCVTMGMNMVFYEAIAELPLGTAVAIEFMGPIVVAAWGSRSVRDWLALLLAGGGVLLMSGGRGAGAKPFYRRNDGDRRGGGGCGCA